ncbi:MAG: hypothetical protein PHV39_01000 [Methanomicrobium sp.]|nr:hypothetical protein [Methanomicrobium sp.]
MKILTKRSCNIQEFYIKMEIGWERNRGDIVAYAKLAKENGGKIDPDLIRNKFLGSCSPDIAISILNYCVKNHIFEWEIPGEIADLTEYGYQCAENERYHEFEKDIYHIILPDDPYGKVEIINCDPISYSDNRLPDRPEFTDLPEKIRSLIDGCEFELSRKKKVGSEYQTLYERGKIFEIEDKCIILENNDKIMINGEINEGSHLNEYFADNERKSWGRDDVNNVTMNQGLMKNYPEIFEWDVNFNGFKTSFPTNKIISTTDKLKGNILLKNVKLAELFGDSVLDIQYNDCKLVPKTTEDAQKWYFYLIEKEISDYISEDELNSLQINNKQHFEEFEHIYSQINVPGRKILINSILKKDGSFNTKFWYLQAPVDLSLEINK